MEKRRVRLEVDGVTLGLVTGEADEYMDALGREVEAAVRAIHTAAPGLTREVAALTVALGYCDDVHKAASAAREESRVEELEGQLAELTQRSAREEQEKEQLRGDYLRLMEENTRLKEDCARLETEKTQSEMEKLQLQVENTRLKEQAAAPEQAAPAATPALAEKPAAQKAAGGEKPKGNPLRYEEQLDQMGLVSFFEQGHEGE